MVASERDMCHYKFGSHPPHTYDLFTCAWCYSFLFLEKGLMANTKYPILVAKKDVRVHFEPNIYNTSSKRQICATLTNDECDRWVACCGAAHDCCQRQLSAPDDNSTCGMTWDGFGCWDKAQPETQNYMDCPLYITYSMPTRA